MVGRTTVQFAPFALLAFAAPLIFMSPALASLHPARDLVVTGKLKNLDYQLVGSPDDLLGQGWITADLRVKRTLEGSAPSRVLRIRYFAHTYLREDRQFKFHLRRREDGTYLVCMPAGSIGVQCN
jgi:hypothetical protein